MKITKLELKEMFKHQLEKIAWINMINKTKILGNNQIIILENECFYITDANITRQELVKQYRKKLVAKLVRLPSDIYLREIYKYMKQ